MNLPPYPVYRHLNLEWLNSAPSHWNDAPLRSLFRRVKRTGHGGEILLSVYREFGVIEKASRTDNFNNASEDLEAYQLVNPGDLAINKMKAWQGSVAISSIRGIVSPAYFIFRPTHIASPAYLHHLFRSKEYTSAYALVSKGVRVNQWDLDPEQHGSMKVLLPPLDEQRQIAEYLDRETGKIDELITKQEELVATLTERRQVVIANAVTRGVDSGVNLAGSTRPAAGLTPQGWSSDKLSRHFVAKKGSTAALLTREYCGSVAGEFPVFSGQTENGGVLALIDSYEFDSGDQGVLFSTTVGARAMTVRHIFGKFSLSQNCMIIQRIQNANMRFYFYFFQNLFAAKRAELSEHMQASFTMNDLYSFKILLPPLSTQTEIARWLDLEMIKLDDLSAKVSEAIKLLRERRAALISAAVTGKIDVRGL